MVAWGIAAGSALVALGAVVYALVKVSRAGDVVRSVMGKNADIRETKAILSAANESLSLQNSSLTERLKELEEARRKLREKYEETVQELMSTADTSTLHDHLNDRLRELSEMQTRGNH